MNNWRLWFKTVNRNFDSLSRASDKLKATPKRSKARLSGIKIWLISIPALMYCADSMSLSALPF